MPDDAGDLQRLRDAIYLPGLDIIHTDSSTLIGKLSGGPLQYLHKLFAPRPTAINDLEVILGFPPPRSYAAFFSFSDGATLFDNTLFLYGTHGIANRSTSVEDVRPISLREQVEIQRLATLKLDWIEVGSLAAATKSYSLNINSAGSVAVCGKEGARRECKSFLSMLLLITKLLNQHSDESGLYDPTAEMLQEEIDRFITTLRQ